MDKLTTRAFSTLEILIAMMIGVTVISAIILVTFGDQSAILGGETNAEAVTKAQALQEAAQALARVDFALVNNVATTSDGIYQKSVKVELLPDYLTKLVTTFVAWTGEHGQQLYTKLTSIVTDLENVSAPNSCGAPLNGDWEHPQITGPIDVTDPANSSSGNPVTDLDILNKRLYITTDNQHGNNDDFYVFDISVNPKNPQYLYSTTTVTAHAGLNAIATASTSVTRYAYVASANGPTFTSCKLGPNCSQLQVINLLNKNVAVTNYLVPTSSAPFVLGSGGQAAGKSIYYKDGIVYLGLTKTASGPEFIVIDVGGGGTGGTPTAPKYLGSYPVGKTVNAILVKGNYAYLTTDDQTKDLLVLNIATPSAPASIPMPGGYFNSSGIGFGKGEYVVGNTLYFGSTYAGDAAHEFYFLNITNPIATLTSFASKNIGTAADTQSVNGIIVRDYLAFLTTRDYFQVWNITIPSSMSLVKQFDLTAIVGPGSGALASDCDGDYMYVGSFRNNNDKGVVLVVYPGSPLDYTLSNTGNVSVLQGSSGNTNVTRTLTQGTAQPVTLSATGLPAGASVAYANNPCTTTCTSTLTISTTAVTPVGTYPITVTGSPAGTSNPSTTFNLVVGPQAFDYSLSAAPASKTMSQGTSYTETVTVTQTAGTPQPVSVTLSGMQNNVTYTPVPGTCTPNPTCTIPLTISAASNAQKLTKTITVNGSSPTRTTTFTLTVTN